MGTIQPSCQPPGCFLQVVIGMCGGRLLLFLCFVGAICFVSVCCSENGDFSGGFCSPEEVAAHTVLWSGLGESSCPTAAIHRKSKQHVHITGHMVVLTRFQGCTSSNLPVALIT